MSRRGPFPGMDPWLESQWEGIHHDLISMAAKHLNKALPEDLIARIGERVYVEYSDGDSRSILPDVVVAESGFQSWPGGGGAAVALADEPVLLRLTDELPTEGFIEIVEAKNHRAVITAIEVLSPTNKLRSGPRREYRQKRREYHHAKASIVEIDLLRRGRHLVDVPLELIPRRLLTPYKVCVRRGWRMIDREAEYYPIPLRSRLPRIRVPLRKGEPDAVLDLQLLLDTVYVDGRYDRTQYADPPNPPLSDVDINWALEQIKRWQVPIPPPDTSDSRV